MRFVVAIAIVVIVASPAGAAPEDVANEVSREVMSPFCPGVTLHDCPSQAALDLRDQIKGWAEQGWSKDRIMDELESRFGTGIRATPQDSEGIGAWALPVGALLVGIMLLGSLARRWTKGRLHREVPALDDAERARVERELAALRESTP